MNLAEYDRDSHDGKPCARAGCPGRVTAEAREYCSLLCSCLVREYERNADWLEHATANGLSNAIEYAAAQRQVLDRLSEVLSEYRNTRRPAEHSRYMKDQKREAAAAIERMRAAGYLGNQIKTSGD